jgi:GNAT superfamily N-acetyltransferase
MVVKQAKRLPSLYRREKNMSHVEITIREACIEDSSAIAAILYTLGWSEQLKREDPGQIQADIAARIEQCIREQTHTILVAERWCNKCNQSVGDTSRSGQVARQVIGYISVHWFPNMLMLGYDGYVSELFIHPDETGLGAGSRLLETVQAYAAERGCTRLLLMNRRIRESYRRHFYVKQGWEELPDAAFFSLKLPVNV